MKSLSTNLDIAVVFYATIINKATGASYIVGKGKLIFSNDISLILALI